MFERPKKITLNSVGIGSKCDEQRRLKQSFISLAVCLYFTIIMIVIVSVIINIRCFI